MKFDLDKVGAPLAIAASVVGIWVYLRNKSGGTQGIVNNPATNVPGTTTYLPGLTQVLFSTGQGAGGAGGPKQAVPSIAANVAAAANPTSASPAAPQIQVPPAYLTYNYGPQFAFSKLPVLMAMGDSHMATLPAGIQSGKKSGGCGCAGGGGCGGGCQSCVSKCDQINARFPDGRGGCFSRTVSPTYVNAMATNINGYSLSESIIPTAPMLGLSGGA